MCIFYDARIKIIEYLCLGCCVVSAVAAHSQMQNFSFLIPDSKPIKDGVTMVCRG